MTQRELQVLIEAQLAMLGESSGRGTPVLTTAEVAPCSCPDFCERDHDLD
jgi:hypothetical protein